MTRFAALSRIWQLAITVWSLVIVAVLARMLFLSLFTVAALSLIVLPAAAQVKYVDRDGRSHWVQSEAQVPAEYRAERPALPGMGGSSGKACASGDPKTDASCNRAEWRSAMTKLCYVYGANTDDCREFKRVNAQRNVRDMMRR